MFFSTANLWVAADGRRNNQGNIWKKNWIAICAKLSAEEGGSSFKKDLKALKILKKNIFHKPPPQDVVEVTPVSYALVLECYRYSASDS